MRVDLEAWRIQAFNLCERREWSTRWDARLANHLLEAAEFSEALRGKKGDVIEEAGDLLFTALAMIPSNISLDDVFALNQEKIRGLMGAPPYPGEQKR